mmetsp:Transcript_73593/g.207853  ORF Transcript_73593/g.207853 Transcript_73593/m.207853 type:complete len:208 (+) Transcript_73593:2-625(+)
MTFCVFRCVSDQSENGSKPSVKHSSFECTSRRASKLRMFITIAGALLAGFQQCRGAAGLHIAGRIVPLLFHAADAVRCRLVVEPHTERHQVHRDALVLGQVLLPLDGASVARLHATTILHLTRAVVRAAHGHQAYLRRAARLPALATLDGDAVLRPRERVLVRGIGAGVSGRGLVEGEARGLYGPTHHEHGNGCDHTLPTAGQHRTI